MIINSSALSLPTTGNPSTNNPIIGYNNLVTSGNIVADTSDPNFPDDNLGNPSTASRWAANDNTTQYITLDLTLSSTSLDYLAVARHNLNDTGITVSVEVQTTSGGSWTAVTTPQVPVDDAPIIFRFVPTVLFGIRLKLVGGSTPATIAVLYIGLLLSIPRRFYVGHSPLTLSRNVTVTNGQSETGNFLGRIVLGRFVSTTVALQHLDPAWYRTYMDPFILASEEAPFFFAWRPSDYPDEIGYAWMSGNPIPANQLPNGMMSVSLQMGGIVL